MSDLRDRKLKFETQLPRLKNPHIIKRRSRDENRITHTEQDTINHLDSGEHTDRDNHYGSFSNHNLHYDICSNNRSNTLDINKFIDRDMSNITINHEYLLRIAFYSSSYYPTRGYHSGTI